MQLFSLSLRSAELGFFPPPLRERKEQFCSQALLRTLRNDCLCRLIREHSWKVSENGWAALLRRFFGGSLRRIKAQRLRVGLIENGKKVGKHGVEVHCCFSACLISNKMVYQCWAPLFSSKRGFMIWHEKVRTLEGGIREC